MCGRFALTHKLDDISLTFKITNSMVLKPRYNISPGETVPIIKNAGELEFLTWGFVPFFKTTDPKATGFINIRSETVAEKPSFRQAFLKNRCLIPVSGYFEWLATGRTKQPYFIRKTDHSMFALAGLWEGGTFGILTRAASHITGVVHPRMPLIIPADFYVTWMNYKTPIAELKKILLINFEENLEIYPVSTRMNNAKFEDPACILALQ